MLFAPPPPPENPHAPFVYVNGEIRHVDEHGDRYEADIIETRGRGWCWTAKYEPYEGGEAVPYLAPDPDSSEGAHLTSEAVAVGAAVGWMRRKWDDVRGVG